MIDIPSIVSTIHCPLCRDGVLQTVAVIPRYPAYLAPTPVSVAKQIRALTLTVASCQECGHLTVPNPDTKLLKQIYGEYYNFYRIDTSEAHVPHYRDPFRRVFENFMHARGEKLHRILEVGCSTGAIIPWVTKHAVKYVGCDPSDRIKIAQQKFPQHHFEQCYFRDKFKAREFDGIISQFCLEHSGDPIQDLLEIHSVCVPEGLLFLQVPSVDYCLAKGTPIFLAHEHLQYFRRQQLEFALRRAGFEPLEIDVSGPSLVCIARAMNSDSLTLSPEDLPTNPKITSETLIFPAFDPTSLRGDRLALYGAGPNIFRLLPNLEACGESLPIAVFDDNAEYNKLAVPVYGIPVALPTPSGIQECTDIILSLNELYHEQVLVKLLGYRHTVRLHYLQKGLWCFRDT